MSNSKKDFVIRLSGDDATGPAFESMLARAKEAGGKISQELNRGMGGGDSFEDKIRDQFGRGSSFGGIGEMLRGGGALIGVTAGAEVLKDLAEGAEKIKADFYDSDKNAADMAQDLMQSVPVLNTIEQAGAAINELFTGQELALAKAKEEAVALDKELVIHKQLIKEGSEYYHDIEETIKRIKAHTSEIGLPAFDKGQIETSSSATDKKDALDKSLDEQIKKLDADASPQLHDLDKQIMAAQAKLAEIQSRGGALHTAGAFLAGDAPPDITDGAEAAEAKARLDDLMNRHGALVKNRDHQIDLAKSGTATEKSTIDDDTKKSLAQQQMEHDRDLREQARQVAIDQQNDLSVHNAARLQLEGRFLDANIAQIKAAADKEDAEARLAADKKEHDLQQGSREWLAVEAEYTTKSHDIHQQARDKEAEATRADQLWKTEEAQKHATEMMDVQNQTRDMALRATGRTFQAEHEQLEREHQDRLAKIKADAAAEMAAHGEHRDEITQQMNESIGAENQSFGVSSMAQQIENMKQIGPVDTHAANVGITGTSASALTGLAAPIQMKESSEARLGQAVAAMQAMLNKFLGPVEEMRQMLREGFHLNVR